MYSYLHFTPHIDLALTSLYVFWLFFAGLIYYLHRENKREGYPLVEDHPVGRGVSIVGFPKVPEPKTYRLHGGHGEVSLPSGRVERENLPLAATAGFSGAPFTPVGDPMTAGVGPGSWVERSDHPDLTVDGRPKITPLRATPAFHLAPEDPDPRGWPVVGGDHQVGGVISDIWVDQSEYMIRYFEVELAGGRRALLPTPFAKVDNRRGRIVVTAIYSDNFGSVPQTKSADQVTLLEEEKIAAFYGAGLLYAHPGRAEPLL